MLSETVRSSYRRKVQCHLLLLALDTLVIPPVKTILFKFSRFSSTYCAWCLETLYSTRKMANCIKVRVAFSLCSSKIFSVTFRVFQKFKDKLVVTCSMHQTLSGFIDTQFLKNQSVIGTFRDNIVIDKVATVMYVRRCPTNIHNDERICHIQTLVDLRQ